MKRIFLLTLVLLTVPVTGIEVIEGQVSDLGNVTLSPYGMVKGSIIFKVGDLVWYPEEIWVLPSGMKSSDFGSTGETLKLSSAGADEVGSNCETRIYENNNTLAFKITSSKINNGTFCALVYGGEYEVKAK